MSSPVAAYRQTRNVRLSDNPSMDMLRKNIRHIASVKCWSVGEISQVCGLGRESVSTILNDYKRISLAVSYDTLLALSRGLGYPVSVLIAQDIEAMQNSYF